VIDEADGWVLAAPRRRTGELLHGHGEVPADSGGVPSHCVSTAGLSYRLTAGGPAKPLVWGP
jgi:hypothetical protein